MSLSNQVVVAIDDSFMKRVMATLKTSDCINLKENESNQCGLVIYSK